MAYGMFTSAVLYVADSEFLRTGGSTTNAGEIAEVLLGFDYAYNVAAAADIYDQGLDIDMSALMSLMRKAPDSGVYVTNSALRTMISPDAQLQVGQLVIESSFTIKITGIARIIEAIASIFDPDVRAERRERARHEAVMNHLEEERATFELTRDRFKTMLIITNDLSNFNQRLIRDLGKNQAAELKLLMAEAFGQAIYSLRSNEIKTLEAPPPGAGPSPWLR